MREVMEQRNNEMRSLYDSGTSSLKIAAIYGVSYQRVLQIVKKDCYLKLRREYARRMREIDGAYQPSN